MTRKFTLTAADGTDMTSDIEAFLRIIGLEQAAPERVSLLLALQLFSGLKSGYLNPAKIVHEIAALEHGRPSQLKGPIQCKYPPLKGLWHQHYLPSVTGEFARNVEKGLKRYGIPYLTRRIAEKRPLGVELYFEPEDAELVARSVVVENWERMARKRELTGQWIVYAVNGGLKYYLCLGQHDKRTHLELRHQIEVVCFKEFTFLKDLLRSDDT